MTIIGGRVRNLKTDPYATFWDYICNIKNGTWNGTWNTGTELEILVRNLKTDTHATFWYCVSNVKHGTWNCTWDIRWNVSVWGVLENHHCFSGSTPPNRPRFTIPRGVSSSVSSSVFNIRNTVLKNADQGGFAGFHVSLVFVQMVCQVPRLILETQCEDAKPRRICEFSSSVWGFKFRLRWPVSVFGGEVISRVCHWGGGNHILRFADYKISGSIWWADYWEIEFHYCTRGYGPGGGGQTLNLKWPHCVFTWPGSNTNEHMIGRAETGALR